MRTGRFGEAEAEAESPSEREEQSPQNQAGRWQSPSTVVIFHCQPVHVEWSVARKIFICHSLG